MLGLSEAGANAALAGIAARAAGGTLSLYEGTRGAAGAMLIAELPLEEPAFEPPQGGQMRGRAKRGDPARRKGTPTWGAVRDADGAPLFYGTVGEDILLDPGTLQLGTVPFATEFVVGFSVEVA